MGLRGEPVAAEERDTGWQCYRARKDAPPPSGWSGEGGRERERESWQLLRWTLLSDYVEAAIERGGVTDGARGEKGKILSIHKQPTTNPTIKRIA